MSNQSCRTCRFLDLTPNAAGKRVARKTLTYRCTCAIELPRTPDAISKCYGFNWPPLRRYMAPDEGTNCPCYEKRAA